MKRERIAEDRSVNRPGVRRLGRWARLSAALPLFAAAAGASALPETGCTPDVPNDPRPEAMEYDLASVPPRAPQPTSLVINPATGHIDFALARTVVPADCATVTGGLSQAECEFDQYLQGLDGFPTVSPAQAPATAPLDLATLTAGTNVVVVGARSGTILTDAEVKVGFDSGSRSLVLKPARSWAVGESYWVAVRGYAAGVRAANGREVVGSPTHALLKETEPLTCQAADPTALAELGPACPAVALLLQNQGTGTDHSATAERLARAAAAQSVFQLEAIRQFYQAGWALMDRVAGLSRGDTAVLWNFPIHSASVAELDPTVAALVPRVTAADEIRVAVQGSVDPATVTPFVFRVQYGSIVVMDLTAAQTDAVAGFPLVETTLAGAEIVIRGQAPFVPGHQYGVFFTNALHDATGAALVPSPVSVLLRLRSPLIDDQGRSAISSVADADAAMLESGRQQLATLFNDASFVGFTRVMREQLVYCFAFPFPVTP